MAEAQSAISKKDFIAKAYISLKESRETLYWLQLLYNTRYIAKNQFDSIYSDADELRRLLTSITKTAQQNEGIEK
jgi:four helix bundle protein